MRQVLRAEKLATFKCQLSGKCGSLNFPGPQGPVQGSIGIILPFYIYLPIRKKNTCISRFFILLKLTFFEHLSRYA